MIELERPHPFPVEPPVAADREHVLLNGVRYELETEDWGWSVRLYDGRALVGHWWRLTVDQANRKGQRAQRRYTRSRRRLLSRRRR